VEFNSVHAIRTLMRGSLCQDTSRKGQPSFCCHAGRVHVALPTNNVWTNRRIFMKTGSLWTPHHHMSVHFQISHHSHTPSHCFTSFTLSLFALTSFSWLCSVPPTPYFRLQYHFLIPSFRFTPTFSGTLLGRKTKTVSTTCHVLSRWRQRHHEHTNV
jgi:hypothetical protein